MFELTTEKIKKIARKHAMHTADVHNCLMLLNIYLGKAPARLDVISDKAHENEISERIGFEFVDGIAATISMISEYYDHDNGVLNAGGKVEPEKLSKRLVRMYDEDYDGFVMELALIYHIFRK